MARAAIRCYTQQDPIGLAGRLNLYGFAGGDPVTFSDPFGLCTEADGWKDCDRMISGLQGLRIAQTARRSGEWTYSQYPSGRTGDPSTPEPGQRLGDCTDYVRDAVATTLGTLWAGGEKAGTADFWAGKAQGFTQVEASAAQPGDVVVSNGHAGIYLGTNSQGEIGALANNGRPSTSSKGYKNGDTEVTTFGANGAGLMLFRPLKP